MQNSWCRPGSGIDFFWELEAAGDIVYRRIVGGTWGGEGEAILTRHRWKRSIECQKASIAVDRMTQAMRPEVAKTFTEGEPVSLCV